MWKNPSHQCHRCETLSQFVKHHPDYFRNRKNADRFLLQLLSVVGYLHEHQVVHLDLKPDNILITRIDHDVVLVDLGYCYTDSYIDTKGRTDKYAAPEQIGGSAMPDALDGHHPHTTDEIFLLIHILGVDALAVEHTHLIVQQVATVHLEEIALQLNTDVTTIGSVHAATVGETRQLADGLAI